MIFIVRQIFLYNIILAITTKFKSKRKILYLIFSFDFIMNLAENVLYFYTINIMSFNPKKKIAIFVTSIIIDLYILGMVLINLGSKSILIYIQVISYPLFTLVVVVYYYLSEYYNSDMFLIKQESIIITRYVLIICIFIDRICGISILTYLFTVQRTLDKEVNIFITPRISLRQHIFPLTSEEMTDAKSESSCEPYDNMDRSISSSLPNEALIEEPPTKKEDLYKQISRCTL